MTFVMCLGDLSCKSKLLRLTLCAPVSLSAESHITKIHCSCFSMGYTSQSRKFEKFIENLKNKTADLQACSYTKKRIQHRSFSVNIAKFLSTSILKNICERLLQPLKIFCKDFVDTSYENASFRILQGSVWLQLSIF